jgi:NAD(P)-dependent dehydrogenase (short-subunit alcohol dehydrogenase family)
MKVVLVTGASRGIGLEIIRQHIGRGDKVFAGYRSSSESLSQLAAKNEKCVPFQIDISQTKSVNRAAIEILSKTSRLDIVYHVAGVFGSAGNVPFEQNNFDDAIEVYNINAFGFLRLTQAIWPLIGEGTMLGCITSLAGSMHVAEHHVTKPAEGGINYSYWMSKAAMNIAGCLLKEQLAKKGAKLLLIEPGWVKTDMGGPGASVEPVDSARGVIEMVTGEKTTYGSLFVSYLGSPLPW